MEQNGMFRNFLTDILPYRPHQKNYVNPKQKQEREKYKNKIWRNRSKYPKR